MPLKTLKNIAYLAFGTAMKMVSGLVAFVVLARVLGAGGFGTLMIFLSAAGVLCILSNLGINTYVLREAGRAPQSAAAVICEALAAKIVLTVAMLGLGLVLAISTPDFINLAFVLLLLSLLAEGFTEFFNVGLRATGRFAVETRQSLLAALVYSGVVIATALVGKALLPVAAAYLVSRLLIMLVAYFALTKVVGAVRVAPLSIGARRLRDMSPYSVDAALGALFGQLDGLVLGTQLSAIAVGIYQGGLRIFMSAATGVSVLTNVLLPRASAEMAARGGVASASNGQVILAFSAFGNLLGWLFTLLLPPLVVPLYGPAFEPLQALMPWFGLLFAVRLVAGAWGLLLTAKGEQRYRTACSAAHWLLIALLAILGIPAWGSLGWLLALLAGTTLLCSLYMVRALHLVKSRTAAVAASALPLLLLAYGLLRPWAP